MKNINTLTAASIALASLSATMPNCAFAVLNAEATINETDELVQLLPVGNFSAVDGRPHDVASGQWLLDELAFASLKANTPHQVGDLVIDYEHQTLKAEQNGQPAIAAGFFNIKDVQFIANKGLFIKPNWTDKAAAHLKAGEYKYISAVFGYDKITGRPQFLHSAGLVNRPGVDGMQSLAELAALTAQFTNTTPKNNGEYNVNPLLLAILGALGINVDEAKLAEPAALSALKTQATTAIAALQADANKVTALNQSIAALKAEGGEKYDPAKHVPIAAVTEMQGQLTALQAQVNGGQVDGLVKAGLDDGRILPAMENWARDLGNQDVAQLEAYLNTAAPIAALKGKQTTDDNEQHNNDVTALSAEDKYAADQLGISHEKFAKNKGNQ